MFNIELILTLVSGLTFSGFIYFWVAYNVSKKENLELKTLYKKATEEPVDFKYIKESTDFLDELIRLKFSYYLYTFFIPLYLDKKVPEKAKVEEIKEKIYVSVVGGLSMRTKKSIMGFFTEKGVQMYINERILNHMNEVDYRTSDKYTESFKDLKAGGIETLMP